MKRIITNTAVLLAVVLGFTSCNKWLDGTTSTSYLTDQIVWGEASSVDLYVNGFYTYIHKYSQFGDYQFGGSFTESLTDTFKYGSLSLGHKAGHPNNYVTNPEAITTAGCLYGIWGTAYENIRRINEFLVSLDKYSSFSDEQNAIWEGQARFFRAFIYFQLAKRHPQGVILYTDLNMTNNKARSSASEMWDLIEADLDYAASVLPETWNKDNSGRVSKNAVYAFKSRAMLYAERWQSAYDAAQQVITSLHYSLVPDYNDACKGGNSESILEFRYSVNGPNHNFDQDYVPICDGYDYGALGTPTQEMVECYEKFDGSRFDWSGYHDGSINVRPAYEVLEPRFAATVIYNGCKWKGNTMDCSVAGEYGSFVEYGSVPYSYGQTTTGYFLRKLVDENHTDLRGVKSAQTWVEIRYAEVLLNAAEAAYRAGMTADVYQKLMDQVRARVGLPRKSLSGEEWFEAYRNERKVELAYEGQLFWDMRRWGLAHTEYTGYRVHGFKIKGTMFEYVSCDLADRRFLQRLYCLPIPDEELQNNNLIEQYDEWK